MPDPIQTASLENAPPRDDRALFGLALRLAAMLVLGGMFMLVKMAGQHGVHTIECVFWRQLAGLPVVVLWLSATGSVSQIRTKRPGSHAMRAIIGLVSMNLNFLAMQMLPMAEATTIGFAAPIFATVLAAILLREATGLYRWAAVSLGFFGVLVALQPGGSHIDPAGGLVALSGAVLTAGVAIQLRRMGKEENTGAIVFWFSLTTLVPLGIAMPFVGKSHDAETWAIIAGLAGCGAVAQILLTSSLRHASVAGTATMDYTALIWSVLFGYWVFGDIPTHNTWIGAPIIIAAGLIIAWREQYLRRKRIATSTR